MKRPYLAVATFALVASLSPAPGLLPQTWANGLFNSAPVESSSFAVLARPVGLDDWSLVVLEQSRARPFCWTPRPDGLVDPTLNRFDFTGVCGRFIDSNGYSLRLGETDLNHAFRLRLEQQGKELRLFASSPTLTQELLVGRGAVPRRDKDLFVSLQLEPGWELRRRMFGSRALNHVYFSNPQSVDTLAALARGRGPATEAPGGDGLPAVIQPPPPLAVGRGTGAATSRGSELSGRVDSASPARGLSRVASRQRVRSSPSTAPTDERVASDPVVENPASGVVALQVIPFEEGQ